MIVSSWEYEVVGALPLVSCVELISNMCYRSFADKGGRRLVITGEGLTSTKYTPDSSLNLPVLLKGLLGYS